MRKIILGLVIGAAVGTPATAMAQPSALTTNLNDLLINNQAAQPLSIKQPIKHHKAEPAKTEPPKPEEVKPPEPVSYTVVEGDNLTKIGTQYTVEWQRIWAKNEQIAHPDVIHIGDVLKIPEASEVLPARELPAVVAAPVVTPGASDVVANVDKPVHTVQNFGGGNTYDYGYCTWYVKNRRGSSIPNTLGNANTWFARAQAAGMATGYAPRAGAVGTTTRGALGHVVYVEAVNGDGTIQISEMNAPVFGQTTYRTANASEFSYIY